MKNKILGFLGLFLIVALCSCKETWEENPVLDGHQGVIYDDFLNEPVMQSQYLMITFDNREGNFHLSCSQPYFGYAALATYKVQISLDESFEKYEEINQAFYDCANINPMNKDVASCMEKLAGVEGDADLPLDYMKVYMRLRCFIEQSPENTQYISNVIYFDHIGAAYFAIWTAGEAVDIYVRGEMNDWGAPAEWQFKTGEEEYTWVIKNVTIADGTSFKIADSAWAPLNLGANSDDKIKPDVEYTLTGGDNPPNIKMDGDFTGLMMLKLVGGEYVLILESAK